MNFEKIEQAYSLILENIQLIENQIKTNLYDALIEQN
ncbi:MAG: class I SAM-dependent methyltransferase, partial [Streptococcus sp.]|nr:class I SAM-dependent methyltransferase [Streptococcus sp.]